MPGPKQPTLTVKQRQFVKGVAHGLNGKAAAIAAGYSAKSATSAACDTLAKPHVKSYLIKLMDKKGLSDHRLLDDVKKGLEANRVISCRMIIQLDDGTVKHADADGKSDDFVEVEDWSNRHKYLETALKLRGYLKPNEEAGPKAITLVYGHQIAVQTVVKTEGSSETNGR